MLVLLLHSSLGVLLTEWISINLMAIARFVALSLQSENDRARLETVHHKSTSSYFLV